MKKPPTEETSPSTETTSQGLSQLDKLLEHRSRLGACVLLSDTDAMTFSSLKQLLKESDGNMGAHMRKLEDIGYVQVNKRFENRKPVTWYRLSEEGRTALKAHLEALQTIIQGARLA